jgi:hypothetical protein
MLLLRNRIKIQIKALDLDGRAAGGEEKIMTRRRKCVRVTKMAAAGGGRLVEIYEYVVIARMDQKSG